MYGPTGWMNDIHFRNIPAALPVVGMTITNKKMDYGNDEIEKNRRKRMGLYDLSRYGHR
jgi:hypothetical protein